MGLTKIAQDPWSESHTIPTFTPPPVEVKSYHVPLTAERAEEVVKTHIERTSSNRRPSSDLPNGTLSGNNTVCVVTASSPQQPLDQLRNLGPPALNPLDSHEPGLLSSSGTAKKQALLQPLGSFRPWMACTDGGDVGASSPASDDAKELLDPWALSSPEPTSTDFSFEAAAAAAAVAGTADGTSPKGAAGSLPPRSLTRHPSRPPPRPSAPADLALSPISRRLSCPEALLRVPPDGAWTRDATEDGVEHPAAAPRVEDALAPLANPHAWMKDREPVFNDGSLGLLYSAASVLQVGGVRGGGWQPHDVAGIFNSNVVNAWDDPQPRNRLRALIQSGASHEAIRTLAAIIIQSYCRGWRARRHVAGLRAARAGEASAAQNARKAAEALAREQAEVRRKLRMAAKDCLFALHAQADYERTRSRMQAAQRLGPGAPPPPALPTIPQALWARCKALGQDPIQVLLDCGMLSQQIEQIVNASQLASQVPRRTTGSSHAAASDADAGSRVVVAASGDGRVSGGAAVIVGSVGAIGSALALTAQATVSSSLSAPSVAGMATSLEVAKAAAAPTRRLSLPGRMGVMGLKVSGAGCKPSITGISISQIMEPGAVSQQLLQPHPPPPLTQQQSQQQLSMGIGTVSLSVVAGPRRSVAASMSGGLLPPAPPPATSAPPLAASSSWRHSSPNRNPLIAAEISRISFDTGAAAAPRTALSALAAASAQLLPAARSSSGQLPYNGLSSPGLPPTPHASTSLKNMPLHSYSSSGASGTGAARHRVSDYSGVGGNVGGPGRSSSGGALAGLGAVGSSAVTLLPEPRGTTLRSRSHSSESGALLQQQQQQAAGTAAAAPSPSPAQPSMSPARLVLPAVQQSLSGSLTTQQTSPNRGPERAILRRRHSVLNSSIVGGGINAVNSSSAAAAALSTISSQGGGAGTGIGSPGLGDVATNAMGLPIRVSGPGGYGTGGGAARSPPVTVGGVQLSGTGSTNTSSSGGYPYTLPPLLQPVSPGSMGGALSPSFSTSAAGGVMGPAEGPLSRPLRRVSSLAPPASYSGPVAAVTPPVGSQQSSSALVRRQLSSVAGSSSMGATVGIASTAVGPSLTDGGALC